MNSTPFAQAPGTGASVSTWSLGMSVAELTLAGACSSLAHPTAAFPSAGPRGLEGIQQAAGWGYHPTAPQACPSHPPQRAQLPFPQHRGQVGAMAKSVPALATSPAFQLSAQISL